MDKNKVDFVIQYGAKNGWEDYVLKKLASGYHPEAVNDLYESISSGDDVSPELAEYCALHSDDD